MPLTQRPPAVAPTTRRWRVTARCGIDSFALKAGKDMEGALAAFADFSVTYQAAADDARPLFRRLQR